MEPSEQPAGPDTHLNALSTPAGASTAGAPPATAAAAAGGPTRRVSGSACVACTRPVVASAQPHTPHRRHILVAVDNSTNSRHALEWAATHLYHPSDKLHLVHVIPQPPTLHPWPGVYVPPDDDSEREEFKEASAMIQAAFAPVVSRLSIPCDAHLIVAPQDSSSIAAVLLNKQAQLSAAVLVLAPHGKGGLQEWWLGSVTREVLQHCPVPVAVVPPY